MWNKKNLKLAYFKKKPKVRSMKKSLNKKTKR